MMKNFLRIILETNSRKVLRFPCPLRMTSAAGKTIYSRKIKQLQEIEKTYEIRMGIKFFFQYYKVERDKIVSGINTVDSLEAFQIVFEHELCHLMEFHLYNESSCNNLGLKLWLIIYLLIQR